MNLRQVPAATGLSWALQGVRTFWRQPLAMSGLFFVFMATVSLVSVLPLIGGALALVLLPSLTLGMMAATQVAGEGRFPMPAELFTALKAGPNRKAMLHLGVAYAAGFLLLMAMSMLADGGKFARLYLMGGAVTPEVVDNADFQTALWVSMLLYMPLSMLFWHAPALVHWHGVPVLKSLFFSWMACWRNLKAFAVYAAFWTGAFVAAGISALLVSSALGEPQMMMSILMPLALLVVAMFFTSVLYSVRDCFTALPRPVEPA
jgi:hypothetical protein